MNRSGYLVTGLLISAIIFAGMVYYVDRSTRSARADAETVYRALRDQVGETVTSSRQRLEELAAMPETFSADPQSCGRPLARMLAEYSRIHDVFLRVRPDGMLDCTPKGGGMSIDFSERLYYRKAMERKEFIIGEFLIGKVSGKPVLATALPVLNDKNEVTAILVAGLKTDWLQAVIDQQTSGRSLKVEIQDSTGTLLTYFIRGRTQPQGRDTSVELIRLPLLPDRSDAQVVIFEQT